MHVRLSDEIAQLACSADAAANPAHTTADARKGTEPDLRPHWYKGTTLQSIMTRIVVLFSYTGADVGGVQDVSQLASAYSADVGASPMVLGMINKPTELQPTDDLEFALNMVSHTRSNC